MQHANDPSRIPAQACAAYEALSGLKLCVRDYSGRLQALIGEDRRWHRSPWCAAVKRGPLFSRCWELEGSLVGQQLEAWPQGCSQCCHAGFNELVVPVRVGTDLGAVLFAGQFYRAGWEPDRRSRFHSPAPRPELPVFDAEQATHRLEALRQLAERLRRWLVDHADLTLPDRREDRIRHFLDRHACDPEASLEWLARELGLSPSRAGAVVRETLGRSFTQALTDRRMQRVSEMLLLTDQGIAQIAQTCGFGDHSHFSRAFKQRFGCSPRSFRQRQQASDEA